jgi:beta-mannosidase
MSFYFRSCLFIALFSMPTFTDAQRPQAEASRSPLEATWSFRQAHADKNWTPTAVPISVHNALFENGLIEDPFYRDNETKLQWIEEKDWEFQGVFQVDGATLARKHIEIEFKQLDTYAHVYINDSLVLETDNMFRTWRADIKRWLRPGENRLNIYFDSPTKRVEPAWKALGYELPGGIRTMSRKAQFHYGWDWGPRFAGCGMLKKPELVVWDDFIFESVYFTATHITPEKARIAAYFRYRSDISAKMSILTHGEKGSTIDERFINEGVHEDSVWLEVEHPRLWWCRGMGEPNLYKFRLDVRHNDKLMERTDVQMGIRKVELVTQPDASGQPFYFKLNGKPVFCLGANYIPQDIFQERVTKARYDQLMADVTASNMNMLRVWGGGIYEEDYFYELCDQQGIMVWQDFMYACALYPGDGRFLKTASREALDQIERLRKHPSMVLWCGNNENNEAWHNWGWQMKFNEAQRKKLWRDYEILFNDLLPTLVYNYAAGVPYWESSPKYSRYHPKAMTEGDSHYWGIWHDEEPFEVFNKKIPRFMSEYGLQSFPEWRTIQSFTQPEDRTLESSVMLVHQKHPRGNALIAEYMQRDYRMPEQFEDFVYVSQLLQAEGMRTGIEAHRRNKPYCMGTLYWQLNDVWPVASWSSIDYYGRWKAMQYYVRESFSPVAALPILEADTLRVYAVCDQAKPVQTAVRVRILTFSGKEIFSEKIDSALFDQLQSRPIWSASVKKLLGKTDRNNVVAEITVEGKVPYRRLFYFGPPRKLSLPRAIINWTATAVPGGVELALESTQLAKNVYLRTEADGFFADNYFDLLPGERKVVLFKTKAALPTDVKTLFKVQHLRETY